MKISQPSMTEQNQTHGVLARIMTERSDAEEYFVTLIPAIKDPEADIIMRTDITYRIGV
jgi:hypothetical protein